MLPRRRWPLLLRLQLRLLRLLRGPLLLLLLRPWLGRRRGLSGQRLHQLCWLLLQ